MRVCGGHGNKNLYILIDSGSTDNFVYKRMANLLGYKLETAGRARVSVACETKIGVRAKISKFKWNFQGHQFRLNVMVIDLGGHGKVLRV